MTESLQERVLHGFFGVLGIAQDRKRHAKHSSLVPPHQRFKRAPVSRQTRSTDCKSSSSRIACLRGSQLCMLTRFDRAFAEKDSTTRTPIKGLRRRGALCRATPPVPTANVTDSGSTP